MKKKKASRARWSCSKPAGQHVSSFLQFTTFYSQLVQSNLVLALLSAVSLPSSTHKVPDQCPHVPQPILTVRAVGYA